MYMYIYIYICVCVCVHEVLDAEDGGSELPLNLTHILPIDTSYPRRL